MSGAVQIRDAYGDMRLVNCDEIMRAFACNVHTLYGMDLTVIAQMKAQYQKLNGPMPMTAESVKEIFKAP